MVTETFPPEVNGVARTLGRMVEGLRNRGHAVRLVRPRQGPSDRPRLESRYEELLAPGFPLPRYPQLRAGLPIVRTLLRDWSERPPEVVHVATEGPLGWSALHTARKLGLPVVTDFHTNFHAYTAHYGFPWLHRAALAWLRRFHNRADCTLVPTHELVEELSALGFERLRVAGRGIDAERFAPRHRSPKLRAAWGAGPDTPVALYVGRLAPEKNLGLALEAFRALRAARPAARLVIVGDGPLTARFTPPPEGAVVTGRLDDEVLAVHYASADLFLYPSLTETFGNVTLEAMASGLAVIAFDYAAARQHIVHGVTGARVPRGEAAAFVRQVVQLGCDLALARTIGRAARAAVARLGWDRAVDELQAALVEARERKDALAEGRA